MLFMWSFRSKKILTLGVKKDPPPHPKAVQLQRMIRYSATLFVQVGQQIMLNMESDITHENHVICVFYRSYNIFWCLLKTHFNLILSVSYLLCHEQRKQ